MNTPDTSTPPASRPVQAATSHVRRLVASVVRRAPLDATNVLTQESDEVVATVLARVDPQLAMKILLHFPEQRTAAIMPSLADRLSQQWNINQSYPDDTVGRLMEQAVAVFGMGTTVRGAIDRVREYVDDNLVFTYLYVVDEENRLQGVVVIRDLMLADPDDLLVDIMIGTPFYFHAETPVRDAILSVIHRHYPVYPVCDEDGRLIGLVHGYRMFEEHTIEVAGQSGRMVGVQNEEHFATPIASCFRYRHPWLQLNLLTAFVAAFVVGIFEDTIAQIVVLAAFLPVLAGQSGNTGCQALAVTLRGMTLGEIKKGAERRLVVKEVLLGTCNGALVGLTAAAGMLAYAAISDAPGGMLLAAVVFLAMLASCVISGVAGVFIPLLLQRFGADPATASTIFLTTATDVVSMGMLLGLATLVVL